MIVLLFGIGSVLLGEKLFWILINRSVLFIVLFFLLGVGYVYLMDFIGFYLNYLVL